MNSESNRFIDLCTELGAEVPDSPASADDLLAIREYITQCAQPKLFDSWFWKFLSGILREDPYDGKIIHVAGAKSFLETQGDLTLLPPNTGFVKFARWTGESDGDSWVFDSRHRCIRCISGPMETDIAEIYARSYGVFFNYDDFTSFLRGVAHHRELMPGQTPT